MKKRKSIAMKCNIRDETVNEMIAHHTHQLETEDWERALQFSSMVNMFHGFSKLIINHLYFLVSVLVPTAYQILLIAQSNTELLANLHESPPLYIIF